VWFGEREVGLEEGAHLTKDVVVHCICSFRGLRGPEFRDGDAGGHGLEDSFRISMRVM